MLYADIVIGAALIYSEKELIGINGILQRIKTLHFGYTTLQPACCTLAGFLGIAPRRRILHALIKSHGYSRAEV